EERHPAQDTHRAGPAQQQWEYGRQASLRRYGGDRRLTRGVLTLSLLLMHPSARCGPPCRGLEGLDAPETDGAWGWRGGGCQLGRPVSRDGGEVGAEGSDRGGQRAPGRAKQQRQGWTRC